MFGLASISNSTPGVQTRLHQYQAQLQQARNDASNAQNRVKQLEDQTEAAKQELGRADDKVNSLENQAPVDTRSADNLNTSTNRRINSLSLLSGTLLNAVV